MRRKAERLKVAALLSGLATCGVAGCGGDARLELAAADALVAAAQRMDVVVAEYHADVASLDDAREQAVVEAFVQRVKASAADEQAGSAHAAEFRSALSRIREDRAVEWQRQAAAVENVAAVREVAAGLQRMGIASLSLQDEMRTYLSGWIEAARRARTAGTTATASGAGEGVRP